MAGAKKPAMKRVTAGKGAGRDGIVWMAPLPAAPAASFDGERLLRRVFPWVAPHHVPPSGSSSMDALPRNSMDRTPR